MKKNIFEDFDGYHDIVEEIEHARKYGINYSADRHSPAQFINRLHPSTLNLIVSDIIEETCSTKTLRLIPDDGYLPPFLAGQYVALFLEIGSIRTSRPYSISSPPNQTGFYDITVRRVDGGLVSNYLLDEVGKGDHLRSSGPAGNFYHNPLFHDKNMICLAGGSGITPFMSIVHEIADCGIDRTVFLFYGNKNLDDVVFHEKFEAISNRFENIHYIPVIEEPPDDYAGPRGLLTGDLIKENIGNLKDKTFYLCGPQGMYDFCIPELLKIGVPDKKIRKEVYGAPVNICDDPGWPEDIKAETVFRVGIKGGGTLDAVACEPLIAALEKKGISVPSLCRSGECSMCRIKIISGKVFQPQGVPVRKSDRKFGYVHSCVSYPLDDLEIAL
jgi:ferredoxin-NADP reductase/ferredoxin